MSVAYEVFGDGEPRSCSADRAIVHLGVEGAGAYLARDARVVTIDPRGNGRSDRPDYVSRYGDAEYVEDTIAVMDAPGIERAVLVGICTSAWTAHCCSRRCTRSASAAWSCRDPGAVPHPADPPVRLRDERDQTPAGRRPTGTLAEDYRGTRGSSSTSAARTALDQAAGGLCRLGAGHRAAHLLLADDGPLLTAINEETEALLRRVRCPVLVIHGDADQCQSPRRGARRRDHRRRAGDARGRRAPADGPRTGRGEPGHPRVPAALRATADTALGPARSTARAGCSTCPRRSASGTPAATSRSPTSCAQLRPGRPGRLARPAPGDRRARRARRAGPPGLAAAGQRVRAHRAPSAGEHDLHAFQAIRRMDEILVANFMVFADLVETEHYDLVDRRRGLGARLLPAREPRAQARAVRVADRLRRLAADARRRRRARPRSPPTTTPRWSSRSPATRGCATASLFVGNPDDVVPDAARARPARHPRLDRAALRLRRLRHRFRPGRGGRPRRRCGRAGLPDGRAGLRGRPSAAPGSGGHLLRRVVAAYPLAAARVPGLRMVVVTGPRIDPGVAARAAGRGGPRRTCPTCTGTWPPATWPSSRAD